MVTQESASGYTNYFDTFITAAPDCPAGAGMVPPGSTVAGRQYAMIAGHPYRYTSDEVLFTVWADRHEIPASERPDARAAFFAKSQACLRASGLGKKFGWGIHHDSRGRVALYGVETTAYREFAAGQRTASVKAAMRSKRGV